MCEKIPMGRRGRTEEIARRRGAVSRERFRFVYQAGQTLFVDGGLTLVHG